MTNFQILCRSAALALGLAVSGAPASAQEEFLLEAGKTIAIAGAKAIAGAAYDAGCKDGASVDANDKVASLVCMAVGSALGKGESEFRRDVRNGLERINTEIGNVNARIDALKDGQAELAEALSIALLAVDLIPSETEAHRNLVAIRGGWNDLFAPLFSGERAFEPSRNLALANEIVFNTRVHTLMSHLNETLVRPAAGNKPSLLEQHFTRIMASVDVTPNADLEQPYRLFSAIIDQMLLEQARGESMYAWAAAIFEAECSENGNCAKASALPYSSADFAGLAARHRHEQLSLFNQLVERMILDRSDPHSTEPNFLHGDAVRILGSADFLTALYDQRGMGLRGRIISAGTAFADGVDLSGQRARVMNAPNTGADAARANRMGADFDWWTKPERATVYQTLHFTDTWLGYSVSNPDMGPGTYTIETEFPWTNGPVNIRRIDMETGGPAGSDTPDDQVVVFGTFLAIARAGGSFAAMRNAWDVGFSDSPREAGGTPTRPTLTQHQSGTVVYTSKSAFDTTPRTHDWDNTIRIERRRPIIVADGGKISAHLHLDLGGLLFPGAVRDSISADFPLAAAVAMTTDFRQDIAKLGKSRVLLKTGLDFGGNREFIWTLDQNPTKPTIMSTHHEPVTVKSFDLASGTKLEPAVVSTMNFSIATSGFRKTEYELFTGIQPVKLYFTRQ